MIRKLILPLLTALTIAITLGSCNDSTSYAELLEVERRSANAFLATQRIVDHVPEDTVFEVGPDAPYYRLDDEGTVYMQVLRLADRHTDKAKTGENIYFRYTRYDLNTWHNTGSWAGVGNEENLSSSPSSFIYQNFSIPTSAQWGTSLQLPLAFVGVESEVNLVILSRYSITSEIANVVPYMYHVRYFHSNI